jgi:glutamine amidotransferase-like uncharacterized protein
MANIGIYKHHPYCSENSASGVSDAMDHFHTCKYFNETDITPDFLKQFDMIIFPGGIGDSNEFNNLFHWKKAATVNEYIKFGGKYLGICMGAYWAGSNYFDILTGVDVVQYIKHPDALIKRSYGTVVPVAWNGNNEMMYFYDGCTFNGDISKVQVIGRYGSGHPAAIIQGNVGVIGPHPEANEYWYDSWSYMPKLWHRGRHHKLLRDFVSKLLAHSSVDRAND